MAEKLEIPPREFQMEVLSHIAQSDICNILYLISGKWFKRWRQFVSEPRNKNPGPVENYFASADDCTFIPSECWDLLTFWYGTVPGLIPIARKSIPSISGYALTQVYFTELKCRKNFIKYTEIKIYVSPSDLVETVNNKLRTRYRVPKDLRSRLLIYSVNNMPAELKLDMRVKDIVEDGIVVLQVDNTWRHRRTRGDSTSRQTAYNTAPGVCGLTNLGSTCFMNSVIQCLSNVPPLTHYFLTNQHLNELNPKNPLGMEGKIAIAYGNLIQTMWCGDRPTTNPLILKLQVSKFNLQFHRNQHDAQELLTFLLDGMHEDVNRIIHKPYVLNNDLTGQEDCVIAMESWRSHRKLNDSIVVDTFHGLLKSRVFCPNCEMFSAKFDPFSILSLPLPLSNERLVRVRFVPYDPDKRECMYNVAVPRRGLVRDLCTQVGTITNTNPSTLIPAEIYNSHFHKFYSAEEYLEGIDEIYIYEMTEEVNDPNFVILPICFWESNYYYTNLFSLKHLFSVPFLVILRKDYMNLYQVCKEIIYHIRRHFKLPESLQYENYPENFANFRERYIPNLYLLENGHSNKILKLDFDEDGDFLNSLVELLEVNPLGQKIRKVLLVQLHIGQRREYYREQPVHYAPDFHTKKNEHFCIYDCLDLFKTLEKLGESNSWFCNKCKYHQRATKQLNIWKLPKVLIIHFKRFSFLRAGDKIDAVVEYPIYGLNLSAYVSNPEEEIMSYDLIGVINHFGTTTGGHYTAYCKNELTNSWFLFNDESVTPMDEENLMSPNAYLLFYQRSDTPISRSQSKCDIVD